MKRNYVKVLAEIIVMFDAVTLCGCGISKSSLEKQVAQSIKGHLNQDGNSYLEVHSYWCYTDKARRKPIHGHCVQ